MKTGALRTHQPKGGMCCTCLTRSSNCEALPFESMPVIEVDKGSGARIVRCSEHKAPPDDHPTIREAAKKLADELAEKRKPTTPTKG